MLAWTQKVPMISHSILIKLDSFLWSVPILPNQYYQPEKNISQHYSVTSGFDFICSIAAHTFFSSLFINWTLFIGFQNCFPNSIFKKYKKKGFRLVEAGKAPAKSMGLGWGTGPLWVFTEAFYILQRCWVMWRTHKSTVCLQFAKIISILALTSHLRLTVQWQFGKKKTR